MAVPARGYVLKGLRNEEKKINVKAERAVTGLLFILPWFIGFLVYYVRSLILTVQFSLSKVEIMKTGDTRQLILD